MPTPEYCLLWINWWPLCMAKAEWAAWAQAIGAIVALGIAIWLPIKARRDARHDANTAVIAFMAGIVFALDRMRLASEARSWPDFYAVRLLLLDAVNLGAFLHTSSANPAILAKALGMRAIVFELFHRSEGHTAGGNWVHWAVQFGESVKESKQLIQEAKALKA